MKKKKRFTRRFKNIVKFLYTFKFQLYNLHYS